MSYSDSLKGPEKERYERKLQCLYGVTGRSSKEECVEVLDPYNISVELWIDDVSRWPPIEFPHVYTYLIDTPGEFTREKLKAFKSLQAYNYYISGWVRTVYYRDIGNENCILMAKVTPSQRINDKPHEAWIGVNKKTGTIITGHCSCMAGLGEVCSHVAAILFKAEACIRLGIASETCTSQPCLWNQAYSKKVEACPVSDISLSRPRLRDARMNASPSNPLNPCSSTSHSGPFLNSKMLYDTLHKSYPKAAIFTVVPGYPVPVPTCTLSKSACVIEPELPPKLTSYYAAKYMSCTVSQVLRLSRFKLSTIKCSKEQASFLEKSTRGQSSSVLWFDHRKGCITSSVVGSVARFQFKVYPLSRVKSILQYSQLSSTVPALEWGRLNEENARQQYYALASSQHINFQLQLSGLHIDTQYPYLGATPDGIVSCDCCGTGLLEIKCPFTYKHSVLSDIDDEKFYLQKTGNGEFMLSKTHQYYFQVQAQLSICDKPYSDFVCWTTCSIHMERIHADSEFMESIRPKLTRFFTEYIFPELLTNKLKLTGTPYDPRSQEADDSDGDEGIFCICRETVYGDMVACDGPDCPYQWFHFQCVGLSKEPPGEWYCGDCKHTN